MRRAKYPGIQSEGVTVNYAIRGLRTQKILANNRTSLLMHRTATMKDLNNMILTIMKEVEISTKTTNKVEITTTTTNKNKTQTNGSIETWREFHEYYGLHTSSCRDTRYYRTHHSDTRTNYGENRRGSYAYTRRPRSRAGAKGSSSTRGRNPTRANEAHIDDYVDTDREEETEIGNNAVNTSFCSCYIHSCAYPSFTRSRQHSQRYMVRTIRAPDGNTAPALARGPITLTTPQNQKVYIKIALSHSLPTVDTSAEYNGHHQLKPFW